jgi:hypothetical protein
LKPPFGYKQRYSADNEVARISNSAFADANLPNEMTPGYIVEGESLLYLNTEDLKKRLRRAGDVPGIS